jgi:hypothetical protein
MLSAILLLAFLQPQGPGLSASPAPDTTTAPVRTEKLTPAEIKALADANQAVADAQAKLVQAKAALMGATQGVELAHHANTDCGCYVDSTGRDYDKVEFKGDTIVIHHIHEPPPSLSGKAAPPAQ